MNKREKEMALTVIDYWKTIEFIGQNDIPRESPVNAKRIKTYLEQGKSDEDKLEIFVSIKSLNFRISSQLKSDADRFEDFPAIGEDIDFCIGRTKRNSVVDYLSGLAPAYRPEAAYPDGSAVSWFSFKTDKDGVYRQDSFRLSPLLWAVSELSKKMIRQSKISLDLSSYHNLISEYDKKLRDKETTDFLASVYDEIYKRCIKPYYEKAAGEEDKFFAFAEYDRYKSEELKNDDKSANDYTDLGKSFFSDDLQLLEDLISSDSFGNNSEYEKSVIDYILSAYKKANSPQSPARINISPSQERSAIKGFFEKVLDVSCSPIGKWPSKFMPALMQQTAVNIALNESEPVPVFSVNGPPGTGKTTLLKEIIAENIVRRALLIANGPDDPDEFFERRSFEYGPLESKGNSYYQYAPSYYKIKDDRINGYAMMVASCNNAAVENITADLPKEEDLLGGLKPDEGGEKAVNDGLREIRDLFDVEESDDVESFYSKKDSSVREIKDIYFTRYAKKLLPSENCWGLISAPLGKSKNIEDYSWSVLMPYTIDYNSKERRSRHKLRFSEQKRTFLAQYRLVMQMQAKLHELCILVGKYRSVKALNTADYIAMAEKLTVERQELQDTIEGLESGNRRHPFFRRVFNAELTSSIEKIKEQIREKDKKLNAVNKILEYIKTRDKFSKGENKMTFFDEDFMDKYMSGAQKESTAAQVANPWFTARYNREREKLFYHACKLHKEFAAASGCLRQNMINLMIAWRTYPGVTEAMNPEDRKKALPCLLQSVFLLTPVISTTFASVQRFFGDVESGGVFGTLIVDEAGQAQPHMAVGAMLRCRKAIIVGDPKQIEPVVTAEADMIKKLYTSEFLSAYKDKKISVQGFADYINPYGTFLGEGEEREWVGCPLVVHRRCIDPMYTISNCLSYDGTMKQQTAAVKPKLEESFILRKSCWIDVKGAEEDSKNHFVKAQGIVVLKLLEKKFQKTEDIIPKLFIITPFTSVKNGMLAMIKSSELYKKDKRVKEWLENNNIGTVHTFQGQGTDEVIFLLGCDAKSTGAANWVNKNIVNVAATRAKFRFYMIGDKDVWQCEPVKMARECTGCVVKAKELFPDIHSADKAARSEITRPKAPTPVISEKAEKPKKACPECGKPLVEKSGKYGRFMGCSGFPKCKYTESIKNMP